MDLSLRFDLEMEKEGDFNVDKGIHFSDYILNTRILDHYKKSSCSVVPKVTPGNELWIGQHKQGYEALVFKCRRYNEYNVELHRTEVQALKQLQNTHLILSN